MALSLGSPPAAVSGCRILCCPDFPLALFRERAIIQSTATPIVSSYLLGIIKVPVIRWTLDIPRVKARWVFSNRHHGTESFELPINMMLGKSYAPEDYPGTFLLYTRRSSKSKNNFKYSQNCVHTSPHELPYNRAQKQD